MCLLRGLEALDRLALLMMGERPRAAKPDAVRHGARAPSPVRAHAILICTMEVDHDWLRDLLKLSKLLPDGSQYQMPQEIAAAVHMKREGKSNLHFG